MMIDFSNWTEILEDPEWYKILGPIYLEMTKAYAVDKSYEAEIIQARNLIADSLKTNSVAVGLTGLNLDKDRMPVDTIVIHHTSAPPGYNLDLMNAVQLLNLYVPQFLKPKIEAELSMQGTPIWSNHFNQAGKMVFYGYHWLLRNQGDPVRLLDDSQLGWHAANWEVNCRSVGLCLDDDFSNSRPSLEQLTNLATHIKKYYPNVVPENIVGHSDVSHSKTICPGSSWSNQNGWRSELVEMVYGG